MGFVAHQFVSGLAAQHATAGSSTVAVIGDGKKGPRLPRGVLLAQARTVVLRTVSK